MNKILLVLIFSCFLIQCTNIASDPITEELMNLNSPIDKKDYLEKIYKDHNGLTKNMPPNIAEINQNKIGAYLELFGYPEQAFVGEIAAKTPWLVIHDNNTQDRTAIRTKYFPFLFKGFLKGDIKDEEMSLFLNRFYEYKFGERLKSKNLSGTKNEIMTLISLLKLETSFK